MPTTKKESLQFGLMMCFGMVLFMTIYNLFLSGFIEAITLMEVIKEFIIGFLIALTLDIFLVGPGVKKIVSKLPIDKSKKINMVLAMSTLMVLAMALFMSVFGLAISYLHNGNEDNSLLKDYFSTFLKNFIVAYPLQLIVMGPLVRYLFIKFVLKIKCNCNEY
ncbi:DUF2798 domain-containing protein [Neobacillus cucumis]|uniref:DUF2798 domain-containing protein n=1 Tax=Neobacillus cucumis TaxID=1740721 RepID=UPI0019643C9E|nr:DUF2798 domain-containing protein [Neobacillus cucumis]MBM7652406.1 hypothetical protein [Neobacillus cucumis]